LKPTDFAVPDYFHKVVDCQWACPAHTPVPEYIRLIAAGRYGDAYMVNWHSNVFPGILGRTCDRPCEPACRRGRVEEHNQAKPEPVAICRLKRVAADNKGDIRAQLPKPPSQKNGKRVACIGAGPASLTVARDLAPLGYEVVVFDQDPKAGGMIRTQIPRFRLPEAVIDEEVGYVLGTGVEFRGGMRIDSLKKLLSEGFDAVFVGSGAPRGRDLDLPGRKEAAKNIHVGIDWLSSVSFGHVGSIGKRVIVLGGGNTAMDKGRRQLVSTGEPDQHFECDDVLVAVGQENSFPWIERDAGVDFDKSGMPVVDKTTFQCSQPKVFFGGDAAFGPKNIIWAVAHGHDAAISIDKFCNGEDMRVRPGPLVNLTSQKMGIHEWSYDNDISGDLRQKVPLKDQAIALKNIKVEVELGFDAKMAFAEAQRCLNCDVQTVFTPPLCIECDACVDICPMDCITFTANGEEADLRSRLNAPAGNLSQDLYIADGLKTGRIMAKDEDVCLHCGLCAERCPTGAWDMRKFLLNVTHAGPACRSPK
jgi:NADPH-dependent glutamate synthase beta subunit-like oxidoreductase